MAEARRCDRCSKFYSLNDEIDKRGEYTPNRDYGKGRSIHSMTLYDINVNRIKHLDLCPACSRSLMEWLNDCGQYKEAEKEEKPEEKNHVNWCDVYKQIFGEEPVKTIDPPFIACPYLKGVVCAHTKTCKGSCELVNKMNTEEGEEE